MKITLVFLAIFYVAKCAQCTCETRKLSLAQSVNILNGYGHFGNSGSIKLCGNEVDIFENSYLPINFNAFYSGRIALYDNIEDVFEEYYSGYRIDHLPKKNTWKAFLDGSESNATKQFGIPKKYRNDKNYSYVFMRISGIKKFTLLPRNFVYNHVKSDSVKSFIAELGSLNETKFDQFVETYGTHYVDKLSIGDFLYQIVVFNRTMYEQMKAEETTLSMTNLIRKYFHPRYYEYTTNIQSASGDKSFEEWARSTYQSSFDDNQANVPFLLPLFSVEFRQWKERITNDIIVRWHLASLDILFDGNSKEFFKNMLMNRLVEI